MKLARVIGNIICILGLALSISLQSAVFVSVLDMNGRKTDRVKLGVPFYIDVEIKTEEPTSDPKLYVDDAISITLHGSHTSVYSINGNRTVVKSFRYKATAYDEGMYTVGPAHVTINGVDNSSSAHNIQVIVDTASHQKDGKEQAFLKMFVEKETVYQGEENIFILRLYMKHENIHIDGIEEPHFSTCTASKLEGPSSGREIIQGTEYSYLEWKSTFYAHNAGTLCLPAIRATVTVEAPRGGDPDEVMDFFSMFGSILGTRIDHKQLYSNAVKLNVLPLPNAEKEVTAVGQFTSFTAKSNLESAKEGEACIVTLELVGHGNFSMIGHPVLELPEGLQSYTSKASIKALGAGVYKKDFEYVVQGIESGNYTIPSQEITVFNPVNKQYKTLKTKPLSLKIIAHKSAAQDSIDINIQMQADQDIIQLLEEDVWTDTHGKAMSYSQFIYCIGIIIGGWLLFILTLYIKNYYKKHAHASYKYAFKRAYIALKQSEKKHDSAMLYTLWIQLFAARLKISKNAVSEVIIERRLHELNFSSQDIKEWQSFFKILLRAYYSPQSEINYQNVYEATKHWLKHLEGKL